MKNIYIAVLVMITIVMSYQVSFAKTTTSVEPKEVSNSANIDGVVNTKKTVANKSVVNVEKIKNVDVIQSKPVLLAQASQGTAASHSSGSLKKPNILFIMGDDIGITNISAYSHGLMGYKTPNIDRLAKEGAIFTDYYAEQSCTAGRANFITGQIPFRTGLTKVGMPAAKQGIQPEDPTIAELLKNHGYATGQFGKNHLGDRNEFLPTVHGFDEYSGVLFGGAGERRLPEGS